MAIESAIQGVPLVEQKFQAHAMHLHATQTVFYLGHRRRLAQKSPSGVVTVIEEHPVTARQLNDQ